MPVDKGFWSYAAIRTITYPLRWLPFSSIHWLGNKIGLLCFFWIRSYRKRALSNLALAKDLSLSPEEMFRIAKQAFQNLAINCLEYPKFASAKDVSKTILCENPETAQLALR